MTAMACLALPLASADVAAQDALRPPAGLLNTLKDVGDALKSCWQWPSPEAIQTGMELTIMVSFRRNGEIFGARITHESRPASAQERALYHRALAEMLRRCSPLPLSESLGGAIAGRPFTFRINDTRKRRQAVL